MTDKVDSFSRSQPCADASALALDALRSAAELATAGPWSNGCDDLNGIVSFHAGDDGNVISLPPASYMEMSRARWPANAAFIALANPAAILSLIAEHRAMAALITEQDDGLAKYEGEIEALTARVASLVWTIRSASAQAWNSDYNLSQPSNSPLDPSAVAHALQAIGRTLDAALLTPTQTKD